MTNVEAIKAFINSDILVPCTRPVENRELIGFFKGMPPAEKDELGKQACKYLGVEWKPGTGSST